MLTTQLLQSRILPVQQKSDRHVGKRSAAMNYDAIRTQLEPSLKNPSDECATRYVRGIPKDLYDCQIRQPKAVTLETYA